MYQTRITTRSLDNSVLQNLNINRAKLAELQKQIATEKRVNSPSDDPNATLSILSAKLNLNKTDRYSQNIDFALSELDSSDKAMTSAVDVVAHIKDLALQAANATSGSTELSAISTDLEQSIKTIMDIANTKFGDKYIFGGLVTEQPPFTVDSATGDIIYNGTLSSDNYQRNVEISDNITVPLNVAGDKVFGQYDSTDPTKQTGLFATLMTLSKEIKASPVNYDNIRAQIDKISDGSTALINAQAEIGGIENRLNMTQNKLDDDSLTFEKFRSSAQDIDLAKVITDYKFQETALQASLQASARVIQSSLLQYLS